MEPYYPSRFEEYTWQEFEDEDWEATARDLEAELQSSPTDKALLMDLALARAWLGEPGKAAETYRTVNRLYPDFAYAYSRLADVLCGERRLVEAAAAATEAIRLDPVPHAPYHELGYALYHRDDLDGAWDAYREVLKRQPDHAQAHYYCGRILGRRGKWEESVDAFRQAALFAEDPFDAYLSQAMAYYELEDSHNAEASCRDALSVRPDDAYSVWFLGSILGSRSDLEGAVAQYREAIRLSPLWAAAHRSLGLALEKSGDKEAAMDAFREFVRLVPCDAQMHLHLGNLLAEAGRVSSARTHWTQAVEMENKGIVKEARRALKRWR